MHAPSETYNDWFLSSFGQAIPAPTTRVAFSLSESTPWGQKAHRALDAIELEIVEDLFAEIRDMDVQGAMVEFGVYGGNWLNKFYILQEKLGFKRDIYGFDSFQGLSEPHPEKDSSYWKRGMYTHDLETAKKNIDADKRGIKLIPGWFCDSLKSEEALSISSFSYARIDCDIYEPSKQCLEYLGPRLSDKAILVFDEWPHELGIGEQLAFDEWKKTVPELKFEFLFYGTVGHFYLRVHRR